jgi:hypothetical protein
MKRTDHYHRIHSRYQVKCANREDGKPRSTFDITVEGNTATIIKKDDIITVEREKLLPNKVKLLFILVFVTLNLIVFSTHSSAEIKSGFYSNKEYGFSISFPSGYTITELSKPEAVVWASNEAGCSITIQVLQLPEKIKNITLDNLSKNNLQSVLNETCQTSFSGMLDGALENCNIISIGGKKAIRFSGSYTDPNLSSSISHKRRQLEASMIFYKGKSYQLYVVPLKINSVSIKRLLKFLLIHSSFPLKTARSLMSSPKMKWPKQNKRSLVFLPMIQRKHQNI